MKPSLTILTIISILSSSAFDVVAAARLQTGRNPLDRAPSETNSGYLNNGEPFSLRKAPKKRPPAYALPPLPISHDPQPLPLTSQAPSLPLNPAEGEEQPVAPKAAVPFILTPPIRSFTVQAQPTFVSPTVPSHAASPGQQINHPQNAFLNPEILRYFNPDANGTYQSRIRLNSNSLFTLPTLNPLLKRGGSTTYQIK